MRPRQEQHARALIGELLRARSYVGVFRRDKFWRAKHPSPMVAE